MNEQQQEQHLRQLIASEVVFEDKTEQMLLDSLRKLLGINEQLGQQIQQATEEHKLNQGEIRALSKMLVALELERKKEKGPEEV